MKRILSAVCAVIIMISLIPVCSFAAEYPTKEILFTYQSVNDYNAVCYYSDGYFAHSSFDFDQSLATMSMSLAMSAFGSASGGQTEYSDKSVNARSLLLEIGCSKGSIETNDDFTKKPDYDSMGAIIGNKSVTYGGKEYTLVALALRGGGYEAEWANNFTLGADGHHEGFEACRDNALSFLRSYIDEKDISGDIKLWICGFSRSAAVANLLAGAIDDGAVLSENVRCEAEDVYAYCFEPPAAADTSLMGESERYRNIFNIINKNGFISYLAPPSYGLSRYGISLYMPTPESDPENYTELRARMIEVYDSLPDLAPYKIDGFKMKELKISGNPIKGDLSFSLYDIDGHRFTQSLFLSEAMSYYSAGIFCSREDYAEKHQEGLRELFGAVYGCTSEQYSLFVSSLEAELGTEMGSILSSLFMGTRQKAEKKLGECLVRALDSAGIAGYNKESIRKCGKTFVSIAMSSKDDTPTMATLIANFTTVKRAHYPELCYAWLASFDSNYYADAIPSYNNGGYVKVRLEGGAATVINEKGETVISTLDKSTAYSYIYGKDSREKEYFFLPEGSSYKIEPTEGEGSDISVSLTRYSAELGRYTENLCYFQLDSSESPVIMLTKDGEISANYRDGRGITPSAHQPFLTYHTVTAEASSEEYGRVSAEEGTFTYGDHISCTASPKEGCVFAGWYNGDTLLSSEAAYDHCVIGDASLTARFYRDPSLCDHPTTELLNYSDAKCTSDGYSGDSYCPDCNTVTAKGETVPKTAHSYEDGICTACGRNMLSLPVRIAIYSFDVLILAAAIATVIISIIRSKARNEKEN